MQKAKVSAAGKIWQAAGGCCACRNPPQEEWSDHLEKETRSMAISTIKNELHLGADAQAPTARRLRRAFDLI